MPRKKIRKFDILFWVLVVILSVRLIAQLASVIVSFDYIWLILSAINGFFLFGIFTKKKWIYRVIMLYSIMASIVVIISVVSQIYVDLIVGLSEGLLDLFVAFLSWKQSRKLEKN